MRAETVTKKNAATSTTSAEKRFRWSGGASQTTRMMSSVPPSTTVMGRSCSVRGTSTAWPRREARKVRTLRWNARTMAGSERSRLTRPPVATAPAPM